MGALSLDGLPDGALLLIDSAPIIYVLEEHARLAARFRPGSFWSYCAQCAR